MKVIYIKGTKTGQVIEDEQRMLQPLLDAGLVEVYKEPKEKFEKVKEQKLKAETKEEKSVKTTK